MSEWDADVAEFASGALGRALRADPERSHRGEVLLSIETAADEAPLCFDHLAKDDLGAFLWFIEELSPAGRDVVISYHVMGINQTALGVVLGHSQAYVKATLARARERLRGDVWRSWSPVQYSRQEIRRTDPDVLGEFRVPVGAAATVFSSGSTRIQTHDDGQDS